MSWTPPTVTFKARSSTPGALSITADSYLTVADADTYFAGSFNNAAWTALTAAEKDIALKEATKWLETLCWKGAKCSDTQPLSWPRSIDATDCCKAAVCTALPSEVVQATAELALALHTNQTAIIGGGNSSGAIKKAQLGGLSVEYFEGGGSGGKVSTSGPLVLQQFPWLLDLLGNCYLSGSFGTSRILSRCC